MEAISGTGVVIMGKPSEKNVYWFCLLPTTIFPYIEFSECITFCPLHCFSIENLFILCNILGEKSIIPKIKRKKAGRIDLLCKNIHIIKFINETPSAI